MQAWCDPYPIPLRFQLEMEEENGVWCVLCIEGERAAKMERKREGGQLETKPRERECWEDI